MKETMKAAVLKELGRFEIEDVSVPEYGPNDILVKIKYAAICGSDIHIYDTGYALKEFPFIIGHEFSSEIVAKGPEVENLEIGDRVMGLNIEFCGECWWCKNGDLGHCPNIVQVGIGFYMQGAFAEYLVIKNARLGFNVHKIPDNVDDKVGSLIEPMSVGVGNVDALEVKEGDRVVILGAGVIGLSAMVAAKQKGAEVLMVNRSKGRLELAKKLGADDVFSPRDGDLLEYVVQKWGNGIYPYHYGDNVGGMADVVIESAGSPVTFGQSFELVRSGGKICIAGTGTGYKAEIDPNLILLKDPTIKSGLAGNFAKSAELLGSDIIDGHDLITHVFDLDDIEEAFKVAKDTKQSMKVLLKIGE